MSQEAVLIALPLIKEFEGYAKRLANDWCIAYQDIVGVWTIGYGSTGPAIKEGVYWTRPQADNDLYLRVVALRDQIVAVSPVLVDQQNRLAAVISFAYNLGIGAYKASTLKRKIDAQDYDAAANEFSKWVLAGGKRVPGLVVRRAKERELFLSQSEPTLSEQQSTASTPAADSAPLSSDAGDNQLSSLVSRFLQWVSDYLNRHS